MVRPATTYTFHDNTPTNHNRKSREDDPSCDGNGSLSYSAASSVNSGAESTDSSFILRGLDAMHDSKEIANFLEQRANRRDEKSVADSLAYSANAESLAYSTDAESHFRSSATADTSKLHGAEFLGSSVQGYGETKINELEQPQARQDDAPFHGDDNILFAPAEHSDSLKRRKNQKKRAKAATTHTPTAKSRLDQKPAPVTDDREPTKRTGSRSRPPMIQEAPSQDEDDVWYSKWWMLCFPDMKQMSPKR